MDNLGGLLTETRKAFADAPALDDTDRTLTYRQLFTFCEVGCQRWSRCNRKPYPFSNLKYEVAKHAKACPRPGSWDSIE